MTNLNSVKLLHLGVMDVPYPEGDKTTGDVAELLEEKYHVMGHFVEELGAEALSRAFEESARVALEDLLSGAPIDSINMTLGATEEIQDAFRVFIDQKQMDYKEDGVPTQASLRGVNHRLKRPYAKDNPVRPSFKDTSLYEDSFRAWIDE